MELGTSTLKWSVVERVLVMCASRGEVPDDHFRSLLEAARNQPIDGSFAVILGHTRLTVVQRTDAARLLKDKGFTSVVLTDSRITRGILTAVAWFGGDIQGFGLTEFDRGLDYLKLEGPRRAAVSTEIGRLRAAVEHQQLQQAG